MPATALASSPERRSFPVPPPVERKDHGNSDDVNGLFIFESYLPSSASSVSALSYISSKL